MPFIDVNGDRFHYRLDGPEGAPLVMLANSLGSNLTLWDGLVAVLVPRFRVLRYDQRGHGETAVTPMPYSQDQLGADAVGLLDALGLGRAHFLGLSMGGMTGQWLGIHAPERIERLILANTGARIAAADLWNMRIETVMRDGMPALVDGVLERWLTARFRQAAPERVALIERMLLATPAEGYAGCCAAIRDADFQPLLGRIKTPTLVIGGTHDPATPPAGSRALADAIPGARYVELDAAHLSSIEAEAAFNEAVVAFLTE